MLSRAESGFSPTGIPEVHILPEVWFQMQAGRARLAPRLVHVRVAFVEYNTTIGCASPDKPYLVTKDNLLATITLSGNHGYEQYRVKNLDNGTVIDAYNATFIQDNDDSDGKSNGYPVVVEGSSNITLQGGTIDGNVDQTTDRDILYDREPGNSAGIRVYEAPNMTIRDWRIDDSWDGLRFSKGSDGFLVEDVWITDTRDDAMENDKLNSGTIRDSLFDGVFAGISLDPSTDNPFDGTGKDVVIDGVLIRMKEFVNEGRTIHNSPLKLDVHLPMPDLHITNSVFAIENVNHGGDNRLAYAWENLVESSGNVFLNLSDDPLPKDYPMPPKGWTVLHGQEARDYWQSARDKWVVEHAHLALPGDDVPSSVPDDPQPGPGEEDPAPLPDTGGDATFEGAKFDGGRSDEIIVGNALDNDIDGNAGNDIIRGRGGDDVLRGDKGADQLWGGAGDDVFLYKKLSDSRASDGIDEIVDFARGDKIDLRQIDANASFKGDQAFVLAKGAPGTAELSVRYDASTGTTVIEANVDKDRDPELTIHLAGQYQLTTDDFIL